MSADGPAAQAAVQSLSAIIPLPKALASSVNPAATLLHDESIGAEISRHLRRPGSGAGDDNLCRWLYDTFQSNDPDLQLVVLCFTPIVAGVYLSRAVTREPLAGFEAVLLALYAHETAVRGGEPETVMLPNLTQPSVYHEVKAPPKQPAVELNTAVISPPLEPYGTVRSTKRARIVGVALELYYSKISSIPLASKLAFCEFCVIWAGPFYTAKSQTSSGTEVEVVAGDKQESGIVEKETETETEKKEKEKPKVKEKEKEKAVGRIPMPWELFQPVVRVVAHCLLGPSSSAELKTKAQASAQSLYARATHDMVPKEILATRSLIRLLKRADEDAIVEPTITANSEDYPEIETLRMRAQIPA